jgi:hypothetical protein
VCLGGEAKPLPSLVESGKKKKRKEFRKRMHVYEGLKNSGNISGIPETHV